EGGGTCAPPAAALRDRTACRATFRRERPATARRRCAALFAPAFVHKARICETDRAAREHGMPAARTEAAREGRGSAWCRWRATSTVRRAPARARRDSAPRTAARRRNRRQKHPSSGGPRFLLAL